MTLSEVRDYAFDSVDEIECKVICYDGPCFDQLYQLYTVERMHGDARVALHLDVSREVILVSELVGVRGWGSLGTDLVTVYRAVTRAVKVVCREINIYNLGVMYRSDYESNRYVRWLAQSRRVMKLDAGSTGLKGLYRLK